MCKLNFRDIPEPPLNPPERKRKVYADCLVCEEPIFEFEDCYEFNEPNLKGCICDRCADSHRMWEVRV